MSTYRKKLIEVALPLAAINAASAREKSIRHGHPSTLHLWWARRPLAAARAVLFAQLVDDPSAWPERFPTEDAQDAERRRLFRIIEDLVPWENSNNETVLNAARLEIGRSHARSSSSPKATAVLRDDVTPGIVNDYLGTEVPPVHDPFAGGGTIPLEAQRLGLRAIASDLNPVAVLINKALIEIPPKFAGQPPVNPHAKKSAGLRIWKGAEGLAEDVRYYGRWMREEAKRRIGHLYPDVDLPDGSRATVIAWLWARTVSSPNPALGGVHVPLISSFWLSKKEGKETWIEPVVEKDNRSYRFEVRTGAPIERGIVDEGTKLESGGFRCLLSQIPIPFEYIREQGMVGGMRARMLAIVADSNRGRVYLPPTEDAEQVARSATPSWFPEQDLPKEALGFRIQNYGLTKWAELFTRRQLAILTILSDLVLGARDRAVSDSGTSVYGDAIATYLALAVSKASDYGASLVTWSFSRDQTAHVFTRQALSMIWGFAEINPFADAAGDVTVSADGIAKALDALVATRDLPSADDYT